MTPALRAKLETVVDGIIDLLDEVDGNPDAEVDDEDVEHDGAEPLAPQLMGSQP